MGFIQQNRVLHPLSGSIGFSLDVSSIGLWGGGLKVTGFLQMVALRPRFVIFPL